MKEVENTLKYLVLRPFYESGKRIIIEETTEHFYNNDNAVSFYRQGI